MAVCAGTANAQTAQATLQGLVLDPAHAVVQAANVRVTTMARGEAMVGLPIADGGLVMPYFPPGDYRVAAEKHGFKRYDQRGIKLDVQQTLSLEITLAVGDVNNKIEV